MVRYMVHGWTRREPRGFAAVVAAVAVGKKRVAVRIERLLGTESEAMLMLVLLAGSLVRKIKRRGDEVASVTIEEAPPKDLPP